MKLEAEFEGIPEDAVFEYGISIVVYLESDGTSKYAIMTHGRAAASGVIGVIEMAKKTLMEMNDRS